MQRLPDWPARFAALVRQRRAHPFVWGQHDCVLWAADVVLALTGADFGAQYRGTYSTALQAAHLVEDLGGLTAIVSSYLGEPISPSMARVGDIGLVSDGGRDLVAVCNGAHWLAPGASGLAVLSLNAGVSAWRVGP